MAARLPRAIVDLSEFTESKNLLVYGDTGSGKTGLIGRLPGKVLILSSEAGTVVLKRMAKKFGWDLKDLQKRFKVWRILSWADLEEAFEWIKANPDAFDWIAIDSVTSAQQRALRAAMEAAVKRNPEKRDIDLPDRGEHQKMQNAIKRMVVDFNELPVNVLWVAQAMNREDKDGNDIVLPFIMGKDYEVSAFVCAQMHAYFYMKKRPLLDKKGKERGTERVLISDSFADSEGVYYWAKDRYMVLPKMAVIARDDKQVTDFQDLIALIDADDDAVAKAQSAVESYDGDDADEDEPDEDEPDDADEPEDEPEDEDEPDEQDERRSELEALTIPALKRAVKAAGIDAATLKGKGKDEVIDAVLAAEATPEDEPEEDDDDTEEDDDTDTDTEDTDDDTDTDDDDDADEDTDDADEPDDRRAELLAMGKSDLRTAVEAAGLSVITLRGKSKQEVVDAVLDAESKPASKASPKKAAAGKKPSSNVRTGRFRPADED